MPVRIGTAEMEDLAQRLAKMRFTWAKWYIRWRVDKQARLDMYRVAVGTDRWHTRFACPNKNLWITLIEKKEFFGSPNNLGYRKTRFRFIEARVEPLPDYAMPTMQNAQEPA